jgi:uncharacterized protein YjiS (DUF1127 family)
MTTRMMSFALPRVRRQRRAGALATLFGFFEVSRQRRALLDLDAHLMEDLGLTEADVRREANKAPWDIPWDVPNHWRA